MAQKWNECGTRYVWPHATFVINGQWLIMHRNIGHYRQLWVSPLFMIAQLYICFCALHIYIYYTNLWNMRCLRLLKEQLAKYLVIFFCWIKYLWCMYALRRRVLCRSSIVRHILTHWLIVTFILINNIIYVRINACIDVSSSS